MKKFIIVALMLVVSAVNAAEISILEANFPDTRTTFSPTANSKFVMDTNTNEGFVTTEVTAWEVANRNDGYYDQWGRWVPTPNRTSTPVRLLTKTVKVDGLMLMGDQAVYQGAEGNVVCGTMGYSRVLKVPTLYLSGNCTLVTKIVGNSVSVKMKTK